MHAYLSFILYQCFCTYGPYRREMYSTLSLVCHLSVELIERTKLLNRRKGTWHIWSWGRHFSPSLPTCLRGQVSENLACSGRKRPPARILGSIVKEQRSGNTSRDTVTRSTVFALANFKQCNCKSLWNICSLCLIFSCCEEENYKTRARSSFDV